MIEYDAIELSGKILNSVKSEIDRLNIQPVIAIIQANDDNASNIYIKNKIKKCEQVGIKVIHVKLGKYITNKNLIGLIKQCNKDKSVNAILVQLPLYKHLDEKLILETIAHEKDVDSLTTLNLGKLYEGDMSYLPLTPAGIMEILKDKDIQLEGKNAVVLGRSIISGKSMALGLLNKNATVTICHSKTNNLKEMCKQADILVSCMGKQLIDSSYVKEGAVVINIGYDKDKNGKTCGDIFYNDIVKNSEASFVTKIFNCSGLMTTTMLTKRVVDSYKKQDLKGYKEYKKVFEV